MATVVGNPVIFELPLFENGVALTGKSAVLNALTNNGFTYCKHKTPAGVFTNVTPGDWAEDGSTGTYRVQLTATGVEGRYSGVVAYVESGHPTQIWQDEEVVVTAAQSDPHAASEEALAAIQARTDLIGTGTVQVTSPMTASGDIRVTQGDVYSIALGNHLPWTLTNAISLVGQTVKFYPVGSALEITCTVTGAGTATQIVKAELTSVQTAALALTTRRYELRAVEADVTLAKGSLIVQPSDS